jgi:putative SOS response-associated peptidase YedK
MTPWRGVRGPKSAPVEGEHELFAFLTKEANATVAPIHPKAMPVILTTPAEVDFGSRPMRPRPSNCSARCRIIRPLPLNSQCTRGFRRGRIVT